MRILGILILRVKIKRLIATYGVQSICTNPVASVQEITQNDIRTAITINRDTINRTFTQTTNEFRTFNGVESLINTTTETSTYEAESAASEGVTRIGQALENGECLSF